MTTRIRSFICFAMLMFCASPASAAVLYSANFNSAADISNWTINKAPTGSEAAQGAITGFDYSFYGIPPAPGSSDTLGMRLRANVPGGDAAPVTNRPAGTISGLSVSPTGKNFGANYGMTFYAWSNFNGAPTTGGLTDNANSEGGTNNLLFAIGTSGTVPLVVGNTALVGAPATMDGIGFATTGDGGIANDYRVYPASGTFVPGTTVGVYAAGPSLTATQSINPFYITLFPPQTAPPVQQALSAAEYGADVFNTQLGFTQVGSFGFAWHKVEIAKNNNIVTWAVDGTMLATYDASALTLGGSNIGLGQSDINTTTTRHPSLLFTVYDNLTVYEVPEPASCALIAVGIAAARLVFARRRWQG